MVTNAFGYIENLLVVEQSPFVQTILLFLKENHHSIGNSKMLLSRRDLDCNLKDACPAIDVYICILYNSKNS